MLINLEIRITVSCWYRRDNFRTSFTHSTFSLIDTILLSTSHDISDIVKLLGGSQIICYVLKQIRLTGFSGVNEHFSKLTLLFEFGKNLMEILPKITKKKKFQDSPFIILYCTLQSCTVMYSYLMPVVSKVLEWPKVIGL